MAKRTDYQSNVTWATRELTKLEKLMFQQSPDSISLDLLTKDGPAVIQVDYALVLDIHNERNNGDKDYSTTYVAATDGNIYKTSSESFTNNLYYIAETFSEELGSGEPFPTIKVFQKPSKTRQGVSFITCTVFTGKIPEIHSGGTATIQEPNGFAAVEPGTEPEFN